MFCILWTQSITVSLILTPSAAVLEGHTPAPPQFVPSTRREKLTPLVPKLAYIYPSFGEMKHDKDIGLNFKR
jgi:hypothetical protein